MSKVLKTGDVKRYRRHEFSDMKDVGPWAVVNPTDDGWMHLFAASRSEARYEKEDFERIARVLSIGPKLVTVRIEK